MQIGILQDVLHRTRELHYHLSQYLFYSANKIRMILANLSGQRNHYPITQHVHSSVIC